MEGPQHHFEMSNALNNDNRTNSSRIMKSSFLLIGANIFLSCVILIMIILVFSGQKSSNDAVADSLRSGSKHAEPDVSLVEMFPGYFRTSEEQAMLEKSIRRHIPVNDTFDSATCTIGATNSSGTPWCVLTPSFVDFHSCCVSTIRYESPIRKEDNTGVERTLAIFGDQKQFFRTETCEQVSGCELCTCLIEEGLYTGVYDTGKVGSSSRYGVAWFNFNGCCKCYNQGP